MGEKVRVLLVEDEVITASSLKMGLEELGYSVCPLATRADKAIELARQEKPDVILMDVNLPGNLSGIEAAEKILDELDTKVVFLTGYHDDDIISKIKALNPLGYFVKPISAGRINKMLSENL